MPLAATSSFVSCSSLSNCDPAALMAKDWTKAMGSELVLEKRTEAVTNFSSSAEKPNSLLPNRDTTQETTEKKRKKTGMGQKALNWSQLIVEAIFVKRRHGVIKYRFTCDIA